MFIENLAEIDQLVVSPALNIKNRQKFGKDSIFSSNNPKMDISTEFQHRYVYY